MVKALHFFLSVVFLSTSLLLLQQTFAAQEERSLDHQSQAVSLSNKKGDQSSSGHLQLQKNPSYNKGGLAQSSASAIETFKVMTFNTKWLWDDKSPNDGYVLKNQPVPQNYQARIHAIKGMIRQSKAKVVALQEIEHCGVSFDLALELGKRWTSACYEGRDTHTGQDVAILTTGHITDSDGFYGMPSKILAARIKINERRIVFVTTHLLSSAPSRSHIKRKKQSRSLVRHVQEFALNDPIVVMGDFNADPFDDSVKLIALRLNLRLSGNPVCSYPTELQGCYSIDYVLISKEMQGHGQKALKHGVAGSDHRPVIAELSFADKQK